MRDYQPHRDDRGFNRGSQQSQHIDDFDPKINQALTKVEKWLTVKIDSEAIKFADELGSYLNKNRFTTAQIRKIFGEVKMLQQKGWGVNSDTALLLLKPKLAYSSKRQSSPSASQAANYLKEFLNRGIDVVINSQDQASAFENFASLFEAILAYHRSFGGK